MTRKEFIEFFDDNYNDFYDYEVTVEEWPDKDGLKLTLSYDGEEYYFTLEDNNEIIDSYYCERLRSGSGLWNAYKFVISDNISIFNSNDGIKFKFDYKDFIKTIKIIKSSKISLDGLRIIYNWNTNLSVYAYNFKYTKYVDYDLYVHSYGFKIIKTMYERKCILDLNCDLYNKTELKKAYKKIKKTLLYYMYKEDILGWLYNVRND